MEVVEPTSRRVFTERESHLSTIISVSLSAVVSVNGAFSTAIKSEFE